MKKRLIHSAYKNYVKKNKVGFCFVLLVFSLLFSRGENRENWQGNRGGMERMSRPPSCLITGSIVGFLQHPLVTPPFEKQ